MMRQADSQRGKIYKWEMPLRAMNGRPLSPQACIDCVDETIAIWNRYHGAGSGDYCVINPPTVEVTAKLSRQSNYSVHGIRLAEGWGQNKAVILHECAHAIVAALETRWNTQHCVSWDCCVMMPAHGAVFMGVYLWLIERQMGIEIPRAQLKGFKVWAIGTPMPMSRLRKEEDLTITETAEIISIRCEINEWLSKMHDWHFDAGWNGERRAHIGNRIRGLQNKISHIRMEQPR